ncbi:IS630 family transposase, partial [Endosaccharibacter trunci]|uniref:IS630 family transposase n=1 Tax=Endosaccharibacter trunci TaxID=2812733 RepID=UPI003BF4890B
SRRAVARLLSLGESTVIRWTQRQVTTGSCAAKPRGGARRVALLHERDWILARMAAAPDLTVRALRAELAARGTVVCVDAVWRFLSREHLTFKKNTAHATERLRADVQRKRERWIRHQRRIDPARLVFVDETWAKTNMTRTHGRAPRGQRLVGRVPHARWTTMTFLAALRTDRIDAPCVIDGPINAVTFRAWVEQFLVPTLQPGNVVVLDNLGSHKGSAVRRAIRAAGAHLLFLPPYSPDLNPIEMLFAKLKTLLRKADERSIAAVWHRIGSLLDQFSPQECSNYLRHAGYGPI